MRQRYQVYVENDELVILEHAELDKEKMSMLCQQRYSIETIREEAEKGRRNLIAAIRTPNFYPPTMYAEMIASLVLRILNEEIPRDQSHQIEIDDIEYISKDQEEEEALEEIEEDSEDLDELLEEEIDDGFDEKGSINMNSSLKIADDDSLDVEDEG